ncbi:MAG: substrate-binding domain-containing protein, partial [Deltaproteobacteria bacterium]|nr:substrate-binding domain-containing protein [Deltaproteobacteria bacterium]
MYRILLLFCACLLFLPQVGCDSQQSPLNNTLAKKELLLYCGTTMAPAMREIADIFEQRNGCIVKIISDGSGALCRSLHINQVGDLYLPGSESYIDKCLADGTLVEAQQVGSNRAVLMVAKDNPLRITADLANFVNGNYRTMVGLPESGSIGQETQLIL